MCKLKSAIILKDRIFMPDHNSHQKMLEELGITDDYLGASKKFVRAELSPKDGDVFSNIDNWRFKVDQDIVPEWFTEEEYKPKMIKVVKEWAKEHIHIGVEGLEINKGENHYIKDCKDVEIYGSAMVRCIDGKASVEYIAGSATVNRIGDSASVEHIAGSASVEYIAGSASVEYIADLATVERIGDSVSVKYIGDSASVKYIADSASVERIAGSASVEYIAGSASVECIAGLATVEHIVGSATVKYISGSATVKYIGNSATVISSSYSVWENAKSLIISDNATYKDNYNKVIYQSGDWKMVTVKSGKKIGDVK